MTERLTVDPFILIAAFRYSLGRMTYAPEVVAEAIQDNIERIPDSDKELMLREISTAVAARAVGMKCDEETWLRVATLLREKEKEPWET